MQRVFGRLAAMGCALVLLAGCGGGGGTDTSTGNPTDLPKVDYGADNGAIDTYSPFDMPIVDQGSDDLGCIPQCNGKDCGDDGCGGSCGSCPDGQACNASNKCEEPPSTCQGITFEGCCSGSKLVWCQDKQIVVVDCGIDACGWNPQAYYDCGFVGGDPSGNNPIFCPNCEPQCSGKDCGDDGCGGSCGFCSTDEACKAGHCYLTCIPDCFNQVCGNDGCGGSCGACPVEASHCLEGSCQDCLNCPVHTSCLTPGFESGDLENWETEGNAVVVTNLGETVATEGKYMLQIASGPINEEICGGGLCPATWTAYKTCLQPGGYQLRFKWKLYSEEFHEWCGSHYQDRFWVTMKHQGGVSHEVFSRSTDELCATSDCLKCGTEYVGLEPSDIQLDQGDTFVTPWVTQIVPFEVLDTEEILEIFFSVMDGESSAYYTLVLVDDVAVQPN